MFYRQHKTLWYQFCNFKHFLKAENSQDSLASSCVEFSIGLSCNPVWDWVTIGTRVSVITASHKRTLTSTVHKLMWAKDKGKISLLTNYKIFWNPQIRYKRRPISLGQYTYHRNYFWRLKMWWNLTTIDFMSTNPSILVYAWKYHGLCSLGIFHSHITDSKFQVAGSNQ